MSKYYDRPTQVLFKECEEYYGEDSYSYGIAYRDEIIDGANGFIYQIVPYEVEVIREIPWVDLSYEIEG